ncbi:MAG: hypothetical protein WA822_08600, partial [Albidovulum sp.]
RCKLFVRRHFGWEPCASEGARILTHRAADHIGRPVFATNDLGVKVWEASYRPGLRPFAAETLHRSVSGTPLTPSAASTWQQAASTSAFPGQWFQAESGLHLNWMKKMLMQSSRKTR